MSFVSKPLPAWARPALQWAGWAVVVYVVAFHRLGFPSFWDPDEAVYAVASRRTPSSSVRERIWTSST